MRIHALLGAASLTGCVACGAPREAPRVQLPVFVDPSGVVPVTTDLGYEVTLTEARIMVSDLQFTIAGETHVASFYEWLSGLVVPRARAHPGHFQAGEVTGELLGRFTTAFVPAPTQDLGLATLIVGSYESANFTFGSASVDDGLDPTDPLVGHTAILRGTATSAGVTTTFVARIDSPVGRQLVGAPFVFEAREDSRESLGLRLLLLDPVEGDTLFDGIDFAALDADQDGALALDPASADPAVSDAYDLLRRTFQTHDHFDVRPTLRPE